MSEEKDVGEKETKREGKPDIKSLVAIIPPAGALKGGEKKQMEKRIRIRYSNAKENQVIISTSLAKELGIKEKAYIVVAGRKRFLFNVILDDSVPENEVYANTDFMKENGIADNSIATIRAA